MSGGHQRLAETERLIAEMEMAINESRELLDGFRGSGEFDEQIYTRLRKVVEESREIMTKLRANS